MAEASSSQNVKRPRPLSPHLQIHATPVNMVMSILHRITGAALYFGTLLLAWWLIAAAVGPDYFNYVSSWFAGWFGKLVLVGYTWALMHHMFGGLRHFVWDTGRGFDLETIDQLSWGTAAASVVATGLIWATVCMSASGG